MPAIIGRHCVHGSSCSPGRHLSGWHTGRRLDNGQLCKPCKPCGSAAVLECTWPKPLPEIHLSLIHQHHWGCAQTALEPSSR